MKIPIFVLIIASLSLSSESAEVDLQSYKISNGVKVSHGYFVGNGRYKLFIGYGNPIVKVRFGPQVVYPFREEPETNFCLVELLERNENVYVIVSIFTRNLVEKIFWERVYFRKVMNSLVKMSEVELLALIGGPVMLLFDVKFGYKHPFIRKVTKLQGSEKTAEYTIATEYHKMKINGLDTVNYRFGTAYDSATNIRVGMRIFNDFVKNFDSVKYHYRLELKDIVFKVGSKSVKFQKTKYYSKPIWNATVDSASDLNDMVKAEAYQTIDKLTSKGITFESIMIDVSELISSEMFPVEKSVGKACSFDYQLYQVNRHYHPETKIKKVVDMRSEDIIIAEANPEAEETIVEVYKKHDKQYVMVTSFMPSSLGYSRELHVFERKITNSSITYERLIGGKMSEILMGLQLMGPVALDISVNDAPTMLYTMDVRSDANGYYHYYTISQPDGKAIETDDKYVFGTVTERRDYEVGNIPVSGFSNNQLTLAKHINRSNVIITNSQMPQSIAHMDEEVFVIIYKSQEA